jgi:hypothetical protein
MIKLPIIFILCISSFCPYSFAVNKKDCTSLEAKEAFNEPNPENWEMLYHSYLKFGHCDNGGIAELYSDSVVKLLTINWPTITKLKKIKNPKFEKFVLSHIDILMSAEQSMEINKNAQYQCPPGCENICKKIINRLIDLEKEIEKEKR